MYFCDQCLCPECEKNEVSCNNCERCFTLTYKDEPSKKSRFVDDCEYFIQVIEEVI
jgi:hypothetical protein